MGSFLLVFLETSKVGTQQEEPTPEGPFWAGSKVSQFHLFPPKLGAISR